VFVLFHLIKNNQGTSRKKDDLSYMDHFFPSKRAMLLGSYTKKQKSEKLSNPKL
jgi:hypothetical protein